MTGIEKDDITGTDTTGHEWDGIKELNNPLPRWWLWTFYATAIWGLIYSIAYPAWPLIEGATAGWLGYSSRGTVMEQIAKDKQAKAKYLQDIERMPLKDILKNAELRRFAIAGGRSSFAVNCVQCHGSGATGSKGYPNLNDDDWLWGGDIEAIYQTIAHGIRFDEDEDTRLSEMPKFLTDGVLTAAQISDVTAHVQSLSGVKHDKAAAGRGAPLFKENCASCHGEKGEGDRTQGAPKLNDAIWLFGSDKNSISNMISFAKRSVMPGWKGRLDAATLKKLAIYVHALGGGE